mgnify:CR=1 FL=1
MLRHYHCNKLCKLPTHQPEAINSAMTDTTKLNPLIEPLIMLAVPALILMKPGGTEHFGVFQALLLALAMPMMWSMHHMIRRKKLNLFAVPGMLYTPAASAACYALNSNHRLNHKPGLQFQPAN